ncbi:DoxX protein, partial [Streptomyces ipomoeae 91-03]
SGRHSPPKYRMVRCPAHLLITSVFSGRPPFFTRLLARTSGRSGNVSAHLPAEQSARTRKSAPSHIDAPHTDECSTFKH